MAWLRRRQIPSSPSNTLGLTNIITATSPTGLPGIINPTLTDATGTAILTAAPATTYTIYTQTNTEIFPASTGGRFTSTVTSTVIVTDAASFAALTASRSASSSPSVESSSTTSHAATATSTSSGSHKSSGVNTTLIIAIVVPIVLILALSFGLFWFMMRRRHRKALKRASFVLTPKEKLPSTTPSTRSGPSVDGKSSPQKTSAVVVTKSPPSEKRSPPPEYTSPTAEIIGLTEAEDERYDMPPRSDAAHGARSTSRPARDPRYGADRSRNFTAPKPDSRPGTANSRRPPPNPSIQARERSLSSPGDERPISPYERGPPRPYRKGAPRDGRGPRGPPGPDSGPYYRPDIRGPGPRVGPGPGARPPPTGRSMPGAFPGQASISPSNSTRAAPPAPIIPPVGVFNQPQYSPIIKETPKKGGLELQTAGLVDKKANQTHDSSSSSARSPAGGTGNFSDENMRIARFGASTMGGSSPSSPANAGGPRSGAGAGKPARVSAVSALSEEGPSQPTEQMQDEDKGFDDSKSDVSSLHEEERHALGKFDFDGWGGESRRVSMDGKRVSPIR